MHTCASLVFNSRGESGFFPLLKTGNRGDNPVPVHSDAHRVHTISEILDFQRSDSDSFIVRASIKKKNRITRASFCVLVCCCCWPLPLLTRCGSQVLELLGSWLLAGWLPSACVGFASKLPHIHTPAHTAVVVYGLFRLLGSLEQNTQRGGSRNQNILQSGVLRQREAEAKYTANGERRNRNLVKMKLLRPLLLFQQLFCLFSSRYCLI